MPIDLAGLRKMMEGIKGHWCKSLEGTWLGSSPIDPSTILDQLIETREALEDMVRQFAYEGEKNGGKVLHTGGLSSLEQAFRILGWGDPKSL